MLQTIDMATIILGVVITRRLQEYIVLEINMQLIQTPIIM